MNPRPSGGDAAKAVRRPPGLSDQSATVTRLVSPRDPVAGDVPIASVQGTLALDIRGCLGMPATPELRPQLDLVDGSERVAEDISMWSARFAQAVVEVVGGDRPVTQLVRWTTARVYGDLGRRVRILARTSATAQRLRTVRPQVRSVHVYQPTADTAEVSVHVRHGQRSRAIAARLERDDGRWQCTALLLG
ncbi:MAG: Rv3235 family protein [Actinomycetota bacterium]|nr:Rv3235 family protein [Actinomycetota bacterium]